MNSSQIKNEIDHKIIPNKINELNFSVIEEKTDQIFKKFTQEDFVFIPIDVPLFKIVKEDIAEEIFVFSSNEDKEKIQNENEFEFLQTSISNQEISFEFDLEKFTLHTEQKNASIFDLYTNLLTAPWTKEVKEFFTGTNGIFSDIQPNGKFDIQYEYFPKRFKDGIASAKKLYCDRVIDIDNYEKELNRVLCMNMPKLIPFDIKLSNEEQIKVNVYLDAVYLDQVQMQQSNPELGILIDVSKLIRLKPRIESEIYKSYVNKFAECIEKERAHLMNNSNDLAKFNVQSNFKNKSDDKVTLSEQKLRECINNFYNIMAKIIRYRLDTYSYTFK